MGEKHAKLCVGTTYQIFSKSNYVCIIVYTCITYQFMQEPGDDSSIAKFARKQLFSGTILAKDDVNGKYTRPLYRYLKEVTGKTLIEW